jgi:nicotinate-nucleotide pyrophosphorylase (carboxylating)
VHENPEPAELQPPAPSQWEWLVAAALEEDIGAAGDVTSAAVLPAELHGEAWLRTREPLCVAGIALARSVFERLGASFEPCCRDGQELAAGAALGRASGRVGALLAAERTALNFLQRLCGIATQTRRFCREAAGTRAAIVDTRKTTPGWRALEKYAVRCGGGVNHRMGLFDGVLIKDNHVAALGGVASAVRRARARAPLALRILVEVESLADAQAALEAGADGLLLDNLPVERVEEIVAHCGGRVPLEATGGIGLHNVASYARSGVDRISVGALTHSAPAVDLTLEWQTTSAP